MKVLEFHQNLLRGCRPQISDLEHDALRRELDSAKESGSFWYSLDDVMYRTLTGDRFSPVAQLNTKRFNTRRKPQENRTVHEPFNGEKFNFTKIKDGEVLLELIDTSTNDTSTDEQDIESSRTVDDQHIAGRTGYIKSLGITKDVLDQDDQCKDSSTIELLINTKDANSTKLTTKVIINVSPIDDLHVLICPRLDQKIPQVLDAYAVQLALQLCFMTSNKALRIGFNSLMAMASVNHQHFHALLIPHQLPIDTAVIQKEEGGHFCTLVDYMVPGFAFRVPCHGDIGPVSSKIARVTDELVRRNIAHNLVMCRSWSKQEEVVVYLFPKQPSQALTGEPFNPAFVELAGFLPMGDRDEFDRMTAKDALAVLRRYCYSNVEFDALKKDVNKLFSDDS